MKSTISIIVLMIFTSIPRAGCSQTHAHKSENEIARMTPEQRAREYCREYTRHLFWHSEYTDSLKRHIRRDGLKAIPALIRIIDEFDPTIPAGNSMQKDANCHAAEILLGTLDGTFRLRAFSEGKSAIDAVRRVVERMRAAHFDTATSQGEHSPQARYRVTLYILEQMEGISGLDKGVRDTFELKYKIKMSDKELLDFSNYLTSQDPYYPTWSETEWYVDQNKLNEAGNPLQYPVVRNIEPFYQAYKEYKAKRQ
jgi:hypothetical protein